MPESEQVAALLIDVEAGLRQLQLWERESPPAEALASTQPFSIDSLNFVQWLQHIFLPTMYGLLDSGQPLPAECACSYGGRIFQGPGFAQRRVGSSAVSH